MNTTGPYSFLRCLETGSTLSLADDPLLNRLNAAIARGTITNKLGQSVESPLDAGLVNSSQSLLYAIIDDIPQMLIDEAIPLGQLTMEPE